MAAYFPASVAETDSIYLVHSNEFGHSKPGRNDVSDGDFHGECDCDGDANQDSDHFRYSVAARHRFPGCHSLCDSNRVSDALAVFHTKPDRILNSHSHVFGQLTSNAFADGHFDAVHDGICDA